MGDFSAPSFSLGLDLDIADLSTEDEKDVEDEAGRPLRRPCPEKLIHEEESFREPFTLQGSQDFEETHTVDNAQEEDTPRRVLKRLRRGPPPPPPAEVAIPHPREGVGCLINDSLPSTNIYDDIEEFSSPEKGLQRCTDELPSTQSLITCGTAKVSLFHSGFIRDNSICKQTTSKVTPASTSVSATNLEASNAKFPFPRLTISPIRKINLVESDSDDSPTCKDDHKKNEESSESLKKGKLVHEKSPTSKGKKNFSASKCRAESFWMDCSPMKDKIIDTPVFDEFCKEYFMSVKDQNVKMPNIETKSPGLSSWRGQVIIDDDDGYDQLDPCKNISKKVCTDWDLLNPQPPAYQYFNHTDLRIQTLVRQRLPHFIPLGNKSNGDTQQFGAQKLDYMAQFDTAGSSGKNNIGSTKVSRLSSSKKQNKQSSFFDLETSDATGSWVNPRNIATIPKDAGKRRISAEVRQSGQWFTDQDGRKVYVSKNGEQSTGRAAYMKYKKESGSFRKPKKKAAAKRGAKSKRQM